MIVKNHMAIIRNLRNILEANVSEQHINKLKKCFYDKSWKNSKILPFRFIAAANNAPQFEPELEVALFSCLNNHSKLKGKTILFIDVSGSMHDKLSSKSDVSRMDTACALAILLREICEDIEIFSFSNYGVLVPARRGFALRDVIIRSQPNSGTSLGASLEKIKNYNYFERLIIITDEQSNDNLAFKINCDKQYIINISCEQNGVQFNDTQNLIRINGWSESVVDYISEVENQPKGYARIPIDTKNI
jgi:60 kDa SS-A/Ro ribonucleoprotein